MERNQRGNPVLPKQTGSAATSSDRRTEQRHSAEGAVKLSFSDPVHQDVHGNLLDYSKSGFRALHACRALHTGQVVEFQHVISHGKARVMWNRILDQSVETGFLIL